MHIFIHNTQIWIGSEEKYQKRQHKLPKRMLLRNPSEILLEELLKHLIDKQILNVDILYIVAKDVEKLKSYIKSKFKVLKAAGGIIDKSQEYVMIFRRGKWDLPKGKMDKGESFKETAIREIEEECGIKTSIKKKIATTWHFYPHKGENVLKETRWYHLKPIGEISLTPQAEEGIEEATWCNMKQVKENLQNSYASIEFVFKKFEEKGS